MKVQEQSMPSPRTLQRHLQSIPVLTISVLLVCMFIGACASITVEQPSLHPASSVNGFQAGAAEIDLTPAPGLPLFGYSTTGRVSQGYWTRLHARAIVVQQNGNGPLAIIQLDLGAVSGLLHQSVAADLATDGFKPADILMMASHTHAGPGAFFGHALYNHFGSPKIGFDNDLLSWLTQQISTAVRTAKSRMGPSTLAVGTADLDGLVRNRSRRAWEANNVHLSQESGISDLIALRIDRRGGPTIAVLLLLPAHGTSVPSNNDIYHGDVHGVVSRVLTASLPGHPVVAVAAGPEGDVSPAWQKQGWPEAIRLGNDIASVAKNLIQSLEPTELEGDLVRSYRAVDFGDYPRLCSRPKLGSASLGGADDGRSFLFGIVSEGRPKAPSGCHSVKRPALGFLQGLLLRRSHYPNILPFHLVTLGNALTLVTVPGEPTTELAARLVRAVRSEVPSAGLIAVAALTNEYTSYFTTWEEYSQQHYEGGSTLYGPETETALIEILIEMARNQAVDADSTRRFSPGVKVNWTPDGDCTTESWTPLSNPVATVGSEGVEISFEWTGMNGKQWCRPLPKVSVACEDHRGRIWRDDDSGLHFWVRRRMRDRWQAIWRPPPPIEKSNCRFSIADGTIESSAFEIVDQTSPVDDHESSRSVRLNFATYNVHGIFLPGLNRAMGSTLFTTRQHRYARIAHHLQTVDVVFLEEFFSAKYKDRRTYLTTVSNHRTQFQAPESNEGGPLTFYNSGLGLLSSWPEEKFDCLGDCTQGERFAFVPFLKENGKPLCSGHAVFGILKGNDCGATKGFLVSRMMIHGRALHLYWTHLDASGWTSDRKTREKQILQISDFMDKHSKGAAVILAGDFNTKLRQCAEAGKADAQALSRLTSHQGLEDLCEVVNCSTELCSKGAGKPWKHCTANQIDYIFFRSGSGLQVNALSARWNEMRSDFRPRWLMSDHPALEAGFEFILDGKSFP